MTGRRLNRSTFPHRPTRPVRTGPALAAGALAVCASLTAGCGTVPGLSGGSADDSITVMTWAPENTDATNKPGMPALATAYARWLNAHGGLGGRKLKVLTCNDHNHAVDAAKCARRAVNENVVAVVGSYSQYSDSFLPPLEGAGIPYVGGYGVTNGEFTSPVSYPVNGGQPVLLAGLGKAMAAQCGPLTLIRPDSIAGDELPQLLDAGLTAGGHKAAADQLAAEDATEYGQQADKALKQSTADPAKKGCVVPVLGDRTATFMDSFRRTREDFPAVQTGTVIGSADQTVINETGGASSPYEDSYIASWYPAATDARWNRMKKVISEEAFGDNRIDPADAGVQTTWIAFTVFKAVVDSLHGQVTANAVRRAIDNGLKIGTGGLTPTLHWEFSNKLAGVGFPRLVNADMNLQVVKNGRLTAARGDFIDVTRTLADAELD
ncbi:ABC transporter substrate-binding protein [Streptomyces sp. NPDC047000]|uniref:ABC transporter substrate-binding protein n=1 Tax=Streptomyces sp. NPDC047000 TaxID=3155474 RepID=UPI0033CDFFA8